MEYMGWQTGLKTLECPASEQALWDGTPSSQNHLVRELDELPKSSRMGTWSLSTRPCDPRTFTFLYQQTVASFISWPGDCLQ